MLLRSILELSSRRAVRRIPRQITSQTPIFLRRELSTTPQKSATPQPNAAGKPAESAGSGSKLIFGSAVVGATILAAYQTGYLDRVLGGKDQHGSPKAVEGPTESRDVKDIEQLESHAVLPDSKEAKEVASAPAEKIETPPDQPHVVDSSEKQDEIQSQAQDKSDAKPDESVIPIKGKDLLDDSQRRTTSADQSSVSGVSSEGGVDVNSAEENTDKGSNEEVQTSPISTQINEAEEVCEVKVASPVHITIEEKEEDSLSKDVEQPSSLLEAYHLRDKAYGSSETSLYRHSDDDHFATEKEALSNALEELGDSYITKDGKLVLDFLQAIHTAEQRQAEIDARLYAEEKRALKDKHEKELKDAAVRELMLAEEAAMLDKELKRERAKAAAALKSLQEKLEEKYKTELEQKQREAESKLEKVEELGKAELAAKIVSEKAAQLERIAEANLNINALCMAFYARSEEARRSHSAHKLALGALALEDALSKGLPIQTEMEALHNYLEGIDKDSILDLVLSSLPDETRNRGTDTLLQLNQKFDALKGTLRHFSLIPPGGGGILAHSVAHLASWLKVKEADQSGDGIESLINKVESYLAEGKIAEAANVLEEGVQGTQASEIVRDWVRHARNRAITEQALALLQSYATSISLA
ncbi:DNA ligase 1 [Morus notabilis]|uniref:DNA ligase 1 n=1 Tax=Morus notabilis TaxID=981085 RepID=UPI000CED08D4|nr:DNA ligase 1 [Morus notabilis]